MARSRGPRRHHAESIAPEGDGKIAVSLWLARDPRIQLAGRKEVA